MQALEDLQSVETAFADLHRRYEKTKSVVEGLKKVFLYCRHPTMGTVVRLNRSCYHDISGMT